MVYRVVAEKRPVGLFLLSGAVCLGVSMTVE